MLAEERKVKSVGRTRTIIAAAALGVGMALLPGVALADPAPPPTTPSETDGGCKENGQAVAGAASAPGTFGETVSDSAPIADDVAQFFTVFCEP